MLSKVPDLYSKMTDDQFDEYVFKNLFHVDTKDIVKILQKMEIIVEGMTT